MQDQPMSEGQPAKNVALNESELDIIFNALTEEKQRLLEHDRPKSERKPLTEGRKDRLLDIWNLQMKIGARMNPPRDTAAPF